MPVLQKLDSNLSKTFMWIISQNYDEFMQTILFQNTSLAVSCIFIPVFSHHFLAKLQFHFLLLNSQQLNFLHEQVMSRSKLYCDLISMHGNGLVMEP